MNAEILCVGTELVLGDILNTNAQYLSQQLALKGINVFYQSSVGDNHERLIKALSVAVSRSNLIIFTGGLGPTVDDITVQTVADALGIEMVKNEEAYKRIIEYHKRVGKKMTENNKKQAFVPKDSVVFQNEKGTAPGCAIESGNQCIIFLPGPPKEMKAMFENSVGPYLDKYSSGTINSVFVHIYGYGESKIDEVVRDLLDQENPTVAPYAKDGETVLRVTAKANDETSAKNMIDKQIEEIKNRFGNKVYGFGDETLQSVLVNMLKFKGLTIATAESCTAGYISKRITDVPGASKVFKMGVTTYSNESKNIELGVPADLIKEKGAVSPEVAACMAKGIRKKSGADIGLSITGIAGPESDGSDKPVGLSYIGISDDVCEYVIEARKGGTHDREYIRYTSASEALNFVRLYLLMKPKVPKNAACFNAVLDNPNISVAISDLPKIDKQVKAEQNEVKEDSKPIVENKESKTTNEEPKSRILNTKPVIAPVPQDIIEDDDNVVSEKVSIDELIDTDKSEASNLPEISKLIDNKEYKPVIEEQTPEQIEFDKRLERDFGGKKKTRFAERFLISRRDSGKEKTRKFLFWIALIVVIAMLADIGFYFLNPYFQKYKLDTLSDTYYSEKTTDYYSDEINPKFETLYSKNNDLIGWISINHTNINYPVVQNNDNDFYLRKGFDKSYSREGSIFADNKTSIEYKKESKNIMLYGHHMVSTGTMFKELDNYLDINFYKKNPTIQFDTLYRDGTYKIFAVFITNSVPSQDNGNFFDYRLASFANDKQFTNWINEARTRSIIDTSVDVTTKDEILTLQTCNDSFETDDNKARLIIMARRTRTGESKNVNTSDATKNENPKYPQIWYDDKQLVNPYNTTAASTTVEPTDNLEKTTTTKAN